MFVYQSTFNVLELKIDKDTEYIIGWKSEGRCNSKFISLHGAFLPNVKFFVNKIGIQFNNASLVIEQNYHKSRTGNIKNLLRNFTLKNRLLGATNIVTK